MTEAALIGLPILEGSPTFARLPLRPGTALGLWSRRTVAPAFVGTGGGSEIAFTHPDPDAVHAD